MSRFTIRFQTPVGASLDATDRYFRQIESFLHVAPRGRRCSPASWAVGGGDVNPAMPSST